MKLVHAADEPAGAGPFPTIFAMHGWAFDSMYLVGLGPFLADGRFLMICPQGPIEAEIRGNRGYSWYENRLGSQPDEGKVSAATDLLSEFIEEACRRYPVDRAKMVALGFSQGGMMAFNLAVRSPEKFAALVGIATAFPEYLAERAENPELLRNVPTLLQHGRADEDIKLAVARKSAERLSALGAPVTLLDYGCRHEIPAEGIGDLSTFLAEKVLGSAARG